MSDAPKDGKIDLAGTSYDPGSGDLIGPTGTEGRIAPQPGRLLELLVAHRGEVVSRDAIAAHLWPAGHVEFDQGIGFAVREIRKVLEAVGGDPAIVETIPRRGYRLRAGGTAGGRRRKWLAGAAALAVLVGVAWWTLPDGAAPPVLVLFPHQTEGDAMDAELADVLNDALTARLTEAGRVGVVGRMGLAGLEGPDDTDGARAALGACLILSGGLRTATDTGLIVFTQLVRTSDRVHVWASMDTLPLAAGLAPVADTIMAGIEDPLARC